MKLITDFSGVVYISGVSQNRTFNLLRYNGNSIEEAYLLDDSESEISSMMQGTRPMALASWT